MKSTMDALEAGADDIEVEDGVAEIVTAPSDMVLFVTHLRKVYYFFCRSQYGSSNND